MEITISVFIVLTLAIQSLAALGDPFPVGYSMGNLGTILWKRGAPGQQPWIPSAYIDKNSKWGLSAGVVSFYGKTGNYRDRSIYRVIGGVWYCTPLMNFKLSFTQLDVFGIYYEQSVFVSASGSVFSLFDVSIEASAYRTGLKDNSEQVRTIGEIGSSFWFPLNLVSLSVSVDHYVIKKSGITGADPPLTIRAGIHTKLNRFGAQGVLIEIVPEFEKSIRLIIGEEYRIVRWLGIHGAVGNNPLMIGIGLVFDWKRSGVNAGLVNHPVLGWSRGFSLYYRK
ncbi:MAG: hypothetical protein GXY77_09265 [Fibrobacter sp.]|nr:hypothetical protein [Fibrobacter sp.]